MVIRFSCKSKDALTFYPNKSKPKFIILQSKLLKAGRNVDDCGTIDTIKKLH